MRQFSTVLTIFLSVFGVSAHGDGTPGFWTGDFSIPHGCSWHVLAMDGADGGPLYLSQQRNVCGQASGTLFSYDPATEEFTALGAFSHEHNPGSNIRAILVVGSDLYVGGFFTHVDGLRVNGIARLDVSSGQWFSLGDGELAGITDGAWVRDLILVGDDLFVAGAFFEMGGQPSVGVARWNIDQQQWHALGQGITSENGRGESLARDSSGTIYLGGAFSEIDGVVAENIAAWNGSNWSALGEGTNDSIQALATHGSSLYAAGDFSEAGGSPAPGIASWDGSQWHVIASDVGKVWVFTAAMSALAVIDDYLYAGGFFNSIDGVPARNLARMDLSSGQWSALGSEPAGGLGRSSAGLVLRRGISTIASIDDQVYVGGDIVAAGASVVNNIARFDIDTFQWSSLGSSMGKGISAQEAWALDFTDQGLIVVGMLTQSGLLRSESLSRTRLPSVNWSRFAGNDERFLNFPRVVLEAADEIYVAGNFTWQFENPDDPDIVSLFSGIARWDSGKGDWSPLVDAVTGSTGVGGTIWAMAADSTGLYVGGGLHQAGGSDASNIARWDFANETWSALGDGLDGPVRALAIGPDGRVYAGGSFENAGGETASTVAVWDPLQQTWSSLGEGLDLTGDEGNLGVSALEIDMDGSLIVGGQFDMAGSTPVRHLARFDGSQWHDLGGGVENSHSTPAGVRALKISESGELFVGGRFDQAGELSVNNLARWHEGQWYRVGQDEQSNGVSGDSAQGVFDLALVGADLVVAGGFSQAGGETAANIGHFVRDLGGAEIEVTIDSLEVSGDPEGSTGGLSLRTSSGLLYIVEVRNIGMNSAYDVNFSVTADPEPDSVEWTCSPLPGTIAVCPEQSGSGLPDLAFDLPQQSGLRFEIIASIDSDDPYTQQLDASASSDPVFEGDNTSSSSSSTTTVNDRLFKDRFEQDLVLPQFAP